MREQEQEQGLGQEQGQGQGPSKGRTRELEQRKGIPLGLGLVRHSWARRQGWQPPRDLGPSRERPLQEPWRVREPSRALELWGLSRGPEYNMAMAPSVVRVARKLEVEYWPSVVKWGRRGSTLVRMLDPLHTFVQGPQSWEENGIRALGVKFLFKRLYIALIQGSATSWWT